MRTRPVVLSLALLAAQLLAPYATANWEAVRSYENVEDGPYTVTDTRVTPQGRLHTLLIHRGQFLVYESNESGTWRRALVQSVNELESYALARQGARDGVIFSVPDAPGYRDNNSLIFASMDETGTLTRQRIGPATSFHAAASLGDSTFLAHLKTRALGNGYLERDLNVVRVSGLFVNPVKTLHLAPGQVQSAISMGEDGTAALVAYNQSGARVYQILPNGGTRIEEISTFWDYYGAAISVVNATKIGVLLSRGPHSACDFMERNATAWRTRAIDPCPASQPEGQGVSLRNVAYDVSKQKFFITLTRYIWDFDESPRTIQCYPSIQRLRVGADNQLYGVAGGLHVVREVPPRNRLTIEPTPTPINATVPITFTAVKAGAVDDAGSTITWTFDDLVNAGKGETFPQTFPTPGKHVVSAKWTSRTCGFEEAEATLAFDVHPPPPPPPPPTNGTQGQGNAQTGGEGKANSPGATAGAFAALGIVALTRRRARPRA